MPEDSSHAWRERLEESLAYYPSSAEKRRRSRLIDHGNRLELAFKFNRSTPDHIDALIVDFIANRVGAKPCKPSDGRPATACYRCSAEQAKNFGRFLAYASTQHMAPPPTLVDHNQTPLSVLLTHALIAFTRDYESNISRHGMPRLEVLSNVLRVVPPRGVTPKEFERRAVLTTRTARVVIRHCTKLGWLKAEKGVKGSGSLIYLTDDGKSKRQHGIRRLKRVESQWSKRYEHDYQELITCLKTLVSGFELEFPHYISGYGPADEALTGGSYLPAEEGPPHIPGRGVEWPVVVRQDIKHRASPTLPALLSQTLTQFALDYEADDLGRLGLTTMFFQHLPDEGMYLGCARNLQAITGDGKSLHERHLNIAIEPGSPSDKTRIVFPTQKTRRSRDAYAFHVSAVESRWKQRFGASIMKKLRHSLEALDKSFSDDLPEYPDTTSWMVAWNRPFLLER